MKGVFRALSQNPDTTPPSKGTPPGVPNEEHQKQDKNMTIQDRQEVKTKTKRGRREGSQASASRIAQKVIKWDQGGAGGLSQGGSGSSGVQAGCQGGAGGTDQGGSSQPGTLEDGQGGAGGKNQAGSTDQAGSSVSGGQGRSRRIGRPWRIRGLGRPWPISFGWPWWVRDLRGLGSGPGHPGRGYIPPPPPPKKKSS